MFLVSFHVIAKNTNVSKKGKIPETVTRHKLKSESDSDDGRIFHKNCPKSKKQQKVGAGDSDGEKGIAYFLKKFAVASWLNCDSE